MDAEMVITGPFCEVFHLNCVCISCFIVWHVFEKSRCVPLNLSRKTAFTD